VTVNKTASKQLGSEENALPSGDVSRGELLNWFLGTSFGALLVSILYPLTRYMIPPKVEELTARTVTLSVKPDDVKANSGQIFRFGSQPGIVIRTPREGYGLAPQSALISLVLVSTEPTSVIIGARAITAILISTAKTLPVRLRGHWTRTWFERSRRSNRREQGRLIHMWPRTTSKPGERSYPEKR